jgi:hypothetical protein
MFIITIDGREESGAYSVTNEYGEQVLYIFEEEDDAVRFATMLEDSGCPSMHVIEVEDEIIIEACKSNGYEYSVFSKYDLVIPPEDNNDFI